MWIYGKLNLRFLDWKTRIFVKSAEPLVISNIYYATREYDKYIKWIKPFTYGFLLSVEMTYNILDLMFDIDIIKW